MEIREYDPTKDKQKVETIFSQYWTDREFLEELSRELDRSSDLTIDPNTNARTFFVADDSGEVVGVTGFRKAPEHLSSHADTKNPAELYIIASQVKEKGIGSALGEKVIKEAKKQGFTELLCYSPETHDSSWPFYEKLGFIKGGIVKDPDDGYPGMLWKKVF
ncbi:MAG: GNAT family N-acetyltransferase [Candidatus Paceibacterota bacterium]